MEQLKFYGVNLVSEAVATHMIGDFVAPADSTETELHKQAGSNVVGSERFNRDSSNVADFVQGEVFSILVNAESINMTLEQKEAGNLNYFILSGQKGASDVAVTRNHSSFLCSIPKKSSEHFINNELNGNSLYHFRKLKTSEIYNQIVFELKHISSQLQSFNNVKIDGTTSSKEAVKVANTYSGVYEIATRLYSFINKPENWKSYKGDEYINKIFALSKDIESVSKEAANRLIQIILKVGFFDAKLENGSLNNRSMIPFSAEHPIKTREEYLNRMNILSQIQSYAYNLEGKSADGIKKTPIYNKKRKIKGYTYNGGVGVSGSDELKSDKFAEHAMYGVQRHIQLAMESVQAGAKEGGINVSREIEVVINSVLERLKYYEQKEYQSIDDLYADHVRLTELINRKIFDDAGKEKCLELLSNITYTKAQVLMYVVNAVNPSPVNAHKEKTGAADMYRIKIPHTLELGVPVLIKNDERNKTSWLSKVYKASEVVFTADLPGDAVAQINRFQAIRELNANVISKGGEKIEALINNFLPNAKGIENITKTVAYSMLGKPGEVNPKIVDMEEDLRNIGTWFVTKVNPNEISREERRANYKYHVEKPKDKYNLDDNNEHPRNNPNLVNSGKDYSYLNMFGINEDFAPMGGFAEGTGGVGQVGVREPGSMFQTPDMMSLEGNPHAPTRDDKPFDENGNKTSIKQSGSGDDFQPKKKKNI